MGTGRVAGCARGAPRPQKGRRPRTESAAFLAPVYRAGISFQYHNLVEHPFPSPWTDLFAFDLIICRNMMIYFDKPTQERLVSQA